MFVLLPSFSGKAGPTKARQLKVVKASLLFILSSPFKRGQGSTLDNINSALEDFGISLRLGCHPQDQTSNGETL